MSSIQLVCINYGSLLDAIAVVKHCLKSFKRFNGATILHPNPFLSTGTWIAQGEGFVGCPMIQIIKAISPTQNECCMYEMLKYVTCNYVMGIQWDGFITNPDAWTDEFLEYDYIAPPWPLTNIVNPNHRVGSGGFFLASKRMVQLWPTLCEPHPFPNDWSTGAVHRDRFEKAGMKYAPLELAMRFGEEIPLDDQPRVEKPLGFHGFQYGDHEKFRSMVYGVDKPNSV